MSSRVNIHYILPNSCVYSLQYKEPTMTDQSDVSNVDVDEVLEHYIACALWLSTDESDEFGGEPFDRNYDSGDLAPEAVEKMRADVFKFVTENHADIALWDGGNATPEQQAGHDFWLNRNGHGCGFWEREWTDLDTNPGERLDKAASAFGECYLYLGDDGKIYCC